MCPYPSRSYHVLCTLSRLTLRSPARRRAGRTTPPCLPPPPLPFPEVPCTTSAKSRRRAARVARRTSDATQEGQLKEGHQPEHPHGDARRQTATAGGRHRHAEGREAAQEMTPGRRQRACDDWPALPSALTGYGVPLQHVEGDPRPSLGLLAAARRARSPRPAHRQPAAPRKVRRT